MNSRPQSKIMELLAECIDSQLDLASFARDFCFQYLYLDQGPFKSACTDLFEAATDFLIYDSSTITPDTIVFASKFFEKILSTHQALTSLGT